MSRQLTCCPLVPLVPARMRRSQDRYHSYKLLYQRAPTCGSSTASRAMSRHGNRRSAGHDSSRRSSATSPGVRPLDEAAEVEAPPAAEALAAAAATAGSFASRDSKAPARDG